MLKKFLCLAFVLAAMFTTAALASLDTVYDPSGNVVDPNAEGFEPMPGYYYYMIDLNGNRVPVDLAGDASDYFQPTYVWEGDADYEAYLRELDEQGELGDESVPITLLGGLAVLFATGAIIVHKKRQSIR